MPFVGTEQPFGTKLADAIPLRRSAMPQSSFRHNNVIYPARVKLVLLKRVPFFLLCYYDSVDSGLNTPTSLFKSMFVVEATLCSIHAGTFLQFSLSLF